MFVSPGEDQGQGDEFVQPAELVFFQVVVERAGERGGLGVFDQGQAMEGAGEAGGDGGFIKEGEFQLRHGDVDEIDAGDE